MIKTEKSKCTGCFGCMNICPVNAITMEMDDEGFKYPIVDYKKCIKCNLCNLVCPSQETELKVKYNNNIVSYLAWNKNEEIRKNSSSGGIFSLLAEYMLKNGGYVCGVQFNGKELDHIIISNIEDLKKLRGSKYIQSNVNNTMREIKILLEKDKNVLFVGTPCQVSGLNVFLKKEYKNLFTVDLFCHGVPSKTVFDKYVESKSNENSNIVEFRDKTNGWKLFNFSIKTKDGVSILKESHKTNIFMKGFLDNLYLRPSCHDCLYTKKERVSDISLGDFWGANEYFKNLDDDKGISAILINTEKGNNFFDKIKENIFYQKVSIDIIEKKNAVLSKSWEKHKNRDLFFKEFKNTKEKNIDNLIKKYLKESFDVGVLNLFFTNNYGAMLTAFSSINVITQLGYNAKLIKFIPEEWQERFANTKFESFANKYIKMTKLCDQNKNILNLYELNNNIKTFVVGSDQVWRYKYTGYAKDIYFFGFVNSDKRIMSYAASFGKEKYDEADDSYKTNASRYLKRFDIISVREKDGVDICKDEFNLNARHVLDPVFLVKQEEWQKIIDTTNINKNEKYIAYNILDKDKNVEDKLLRYSNSYNYKLFNILDGISVEEWLAYIKNCEFLITDSFHGVCFAIIFKKPFLCIANKNRGLSRFKSISSDLGLKNRILNDFKEIINFNQNNIGINYDEVYKKLDEKKQESLSFLKESLEKTVIKRDEFEFSLINNLQYELYKNKIITKEIIKYPIYKRKYFLYKILSCITFGKIHKKFNDKRKKMKEKIKSFL